MYEGDKWYYVTTRYLRTIVVKQYGAAYSDTQRVINNEDLIAVLDQKRRAGGDRERMEREYDHGNCRSRRGNTKRYLYREKGKS